MPAVEQNPDPLSGQIACSINLEIFKLRDKSHHLISLTITVMISFAELSAKTLTPQGEGT
jgi:hypothetical protein